MYHALILEDILDLLNASRAYRKNFLFVDTNWPEIIGSIGGDDTVFVATQSGSAQKSIISKIEYFSKL